GSEHHQSKTISICLLRNQETRKSRETHYREFHKKLLGDGQTLNKHTGRKLSQRRNSRTSQQPRKITPGQVNRQIDQLLHRHFHKGPLPIVLDSALHALVEQDPKTSFDKFLIFNAGPLLLESLKMFRARQRKRR